MDWPAVKLAVAVIGTMALVRWIYGQVYASSKRHAGDAIRMTDERRRTLIDAEREQSARMGGNLA